MSATPMSTIAQMLFAEEPLPNFAKLVGDVQACLDFLPAERRSLSWDSEDIAIFDYDDTRVTLASSEALDKGYLTCLTLSIGVAFEGANPNHAFQHHEKLCSGITEIIQQKSPTAAILWHQTNGPVTTDLIDSLVDAIPPLASLQNLRSDLKPLPASSSFPLLPVVANDRPDLPNWQHDEMQKIRKALYPYEIEIESRPSTQIRLAAHTINATLIMVSLPVGAALLTYSLLRGDNLQLSARAMALTGTVFSLAHSPLGQHVVSLL